MVLSQLRPKRQFDCQYSARYSAIFLAMYLNRRQYGDEIKFKEEVKMATQSAKITALYERLSRDDLLENESVSIANQKAILEIYAQQNGFTNIRHFSDDGTSGTVFNRPGLNALIDEVKAGNVAVVIFKDAYVKLRIKDFLYSTFHTSQQSGCSQHYDWTCDNF